MESQFLSMQRAPKTKSLIDAYMEIETAWSDPNSQGHDHGLVLWRGQQSAIGELMTNTKTRSCIGYAKFRDFWYTKEEFKNWFGKRLHRRFVYKQVRVASAKYPRVGLTVCIGSGFLMHVNAVFIMYTAALYRIARNAHEL